MPAMARTCACAQKGGAMRGARPRTVMLRGTRRGRGRVERILPDSTEFISGGMAATPWSAFAWRQCAACGEL